MAYTKQNFSSGATLMASQMNKIDTALADMSVDYIVEQGTSGIWTYRKWNSGIAECWGQKTVTDGTIATAWGGVYESSGTLFPRVNYPFTFIETPICTVSPANAESYQFFIAMTPGGGSTTSQTPEYDGLRGSAGSTASDYTICYHAIGRWK